MCICFDTTPECDGQTVRRVTITISRCTCMEMLTRDKKGIFLYVIPTDYGYVRSWVIMDMGSSRPDQYHIRIYGQLFLWWNFCLPYINFNQLSTDSWIHGCSSNGPVQLRFEYDSTAIRARFEHSMLQHATRFFMRSHTSPIRAPYEKRVEACHTVDWHLIIVYRIINF